MVKNVLLITTLLILVACSGKGTDVELKVSKSFAISASNGGGAILYINNPDTKDSKTIVVEEEEVTVTLLNGNWDFSVVNWSGSTPFTGDMACARKSAILSGQKVEIDLEPTSTECETSHFMKKDISLVNCHSLSGLTAGETCDSISRGQAGSYRVRFDNASKSLSSTCLEAPAAPASLLHTNLSLPFGFIENFKFELFLDAACSSRKVTYSHQEAFNDDGTLYFAYGDMTSYPPVATDISAPSTVYGTETFITLSYTDYNLDLATSCEVSNLLNVEVTTACSCLLGECKVGVSPTVDNGLVGFDYIVKAGGESSNTANVSFYAVEPPVVDTAPVVANYNAGTISGSPLTIYLNYTDAEGDLATSCEVTGVTGNIVPEECVCVSGVCSVNVSATVYGSATLTYNVTANGAQSNSAVVNFNVITQPVIGYAPSVTGIVGESLNFVPTTLNSNGGSVSCSISPTLPSGLVLDPLNCSIKGTPENILSSTSFTVIAANSAGSVGATFILDIGAKPYLDYSSALAMDLYTDEPLNIMPVVNSGSPITSCTTSPALPAGLYISDSNCSISGITTEAIDQAFTVTATNMYGSTYVSMSLKLKSPFITEWQTSTASETITLPLVSGADYNIRVNWGDGTPESYITNAEDGGKTHNYEFPGTYEVKIFGNLPLFKFNGAGDKHKIKNIKRWGSSKWESMQHAFFGCYSLQVTALDAPDLSLATNLSAMFQQATALNANLGHWDTSTITDMSYMFKGATVFNGDINSWDTSNVTNMSYMFSGAASFNRPIGMWNTESVTNMSAMFENTPFNQPLNTWNTSNVMNMSMMFLNAGIFNQPLNSWDTSMVTNFNSMFSNASSFNQDLSGWNVSSAIDSQYFDNGTPGAWNLKPSF